jgi:thiol-disulfide isomerase/thioredoxin
MNTVKSSINIGGIASLNKDEITLWRFLFGNKGINFKEEDLAEKVTALGKKKVGPAVKKLVEIGLLKPGKEGGYVMEKMAIEQLDEKRALGFGNKKTTLTQNSNEITYPKDRVRYMTHPLSWQYNIGIPVWEGTIYKYHVDEKGDLYDFIHEDAPTEQMKKEYPEIVALIAKMLDKDGNYKKVTAKKRSGVEILDKAIPEGVKNMVEYKKAKGANLQPRTTGFTMPELKGNMVLHFGSVWNPYSRELVGILKQLSEMPKFKKTAFHEVDIDEQLAECAKLKLRTCPAIVIVKNGKVAKTITNFTFEDLGKSVFEHLSKAFATK